MLLNKTIFGTILCTIGFPLAADVLLAVNSCLDFTSAPYINSGPSEPAALTLQVGEGLFAEIIWSGTGASAAVSCKVELPEIDLSEVDGAGLEALGREAGMVPIAVTKPGYYFADCNTHAPRHAVGVSLNLPQGISVRTVNSAIVGIDVCEAL